MGQSLKYYLSLPYKIEIIPIRKEEGGGYMARLPRFGELGIIGDGETIEEAIENLEKAKKERFKFYLKEGIEIPGAEKDVDNYSGKFVVRMPRFLHKELARAAKENGVSLNQYVCTLLAMNIHGRLEKKMSGRPGYRTPNPPVLKNNYGGIIPADEYDNAA